MCHSRVCTFMPSFHKDKRDFEVKSRTFFATYLGEIQPLAFHVNIFGKTLRGHAWKLHLDICSRGVPPHCGYGYYFLRARNVIKSLGHSWMLERDIRTLTNKKKAVNVDWYVNWDVFSKAFEGQYRYILIRLTLYWFFVKGVKTNMFNYSIF